MEHSAHTSFGSPDGAADPQSGAPLCTLLACLQTGRIFAPWEATLQKSSPPLAPGAARTFYCSLCPGSALRVTVGAEIASCAACGWTAARAGVRSMPDLFARDAEPWPALGARVAELVAAHSPRPPPRTRPPPPRSVAAAAAADAASDAALRGLREPPSADDADDAATGVQAPNSDFITLDVPLLASGVRSRDKLPPRRRLPPMHVAAVSPHSGRPVQAGMLAAPGESDNAAAFLPAVESASATHDCIDGGADTVLVRVVLRNVRRVGVNVRALHNVGGEEAVVEEEGASIHIPAGETRAVSLCAHATSVSHGEPAMCGMVAPVELVVRFDGGEPGASIHYEEPFWAHEWRYIMYVGHSRRVLRVHEKGAQ